MTSSLSIQRPYLPATDGEARIDIRPSDQQIEIEYVDGARWDQVASEFSDVVHEQTYCFNAARWGSGKIENIIVRRCGEIIGGAGVIVQSVSPLRTGIAVVKWGPLWRRHGETPDLARLAAILSQLQKEFAVRRGLHLTVMPHADPGFGSEICAQLKSLGFRAGSSLSAPERYLVNTRLDVDELRKSLDQKWRYNLKKAEKNDFHFAFATGQEALETFLGLYSTMLARKKFSDHSAVNTLQELMNSANESFRPSIVLVSHRGSVTAGGVFDLSGDRAVYLYGATDDRALSLRAGYALHWWIATHLCNQPQNRWYDLGGNDEDRGLHQFKKGFVGKTGSICITPPIYHFSNTLRAKLIGQSVFRAKKIKASLGQTINAATNRFKK